jgi:hypothetical protein
MHPSTSKFARRSPIACVSNSPLPPTATAAEPGSEAKIVILCQRAEAGCSLFHPEDRDIRPQIVNGREGPRRCRLSPAGERGVVFVGRRRSALAS